MRNLTTKSGRQNFQISLQREGGSERCGCLRLGSQGVVFNSPKRIEVMADLLVRIECQSAGCACSEMSVEGIVVGCEPCADCSFEITVLFLQEENFDPAESGTRSATPPVNPALN